MNKQMMKMTAMAATLAGMMASMGAAHAAGGNVASMVLSAQVTKTTCQINTNTGNNTINENFGAYLQADIAKFTKNAPETGNSTVISFSNCSGADVAQGKTVDLVADGQNAIGSGGDAFGDSSKDEKIGFQIVASWVNDGTTSDLTATTGTFSPKNTSISIFKAPAAGGNIAMPDLPLPDVTLTPNLFSWTTDTVNGADIPVQTLQVPVTLSVSYS